MIKTIRIITASIIAYLFSWLIEIGILSFMWTFPIDASIEITYAFFLILGTVVTFAAFILLVVLSELMVKITRGKSAYAILPILIFAYWGLDDILALYFSPKALGLTPDTLYYVRAVGMTLFISLYLSFF